MVHGKVLMHKGEDPSSDLEGHGESWLQRCTLVRPRGELAAAVHTCNLTSRQSRLRQEQADPGAFLDFQVT